MKSLYLVIPDPDGENCNKYDNGIYLFDEAEDALNLAGEMSEKEHRPYMVFTWEATVENYNSFASVPELEKEYQVKPGRDFPATL